MNDLAELRGESGGLEGDLSVVLVNVEVPALRARLGRRLSLVDRDGDVVEVKDASEGQSAEACADDGPRTSQGAGSGMRAFSERANGDRQTARRAIFRLAP